ncbi:MAG: rod shape-determining protein MreC [Clostridia bacterium]|nr:rod shape-determining protein MreC [Clostridia bacterium]
MALAIALFSGVFAVMGWGSLLRDAGAAVIYPFQWVGNAVGNGVSGFFSYFADVKELKEEADSLRAENESLQSQLLDAEILADENSWLYRYLSMKEEHSDYSLCAASVISSSSSSGVGGKYVTEITLNRGSSSGIEVGMPVVTSLGLVGVVVEVRLNHCRVSTILDTTLSVGAVTTRAAENGLCEGDYAYVHDGRAILRGLPEEADVEVGDIVITSGRGSVYPYGIPIGRVIEVKSNAYVRTTEAVVTPFIDFSDLNQVVILTNYVHYVDGVEEGGSP